MRLRLDARTDPIRSPWRFRFCVWCVLTLAGAMIGPFTTYTSLVFADRLVYWAIICAVAIIMGVLVRTLVLDLVQADSIGTDAVIAVLQALTIGSSVWAINYHLYGFSVWGFAWFVQHVGAVLVAGLLIVAVRDQFRALRRAVEPALTEQAVTPADADPVPEFMTRLEEPLRGRIKHVSADDHYLHVATTEGSARILMRFRNALVQLRDLPGYRIHRSHWVAAPQLRRVRVEGRRHVAELDCGAELPVSRAYLDDLRRAGYLD